MSRFSRINAIWRKELVDTLRDRRTVLAMVIIPIILYPALMLGSLQAFELQTTQLEREVYTVAVASEAVGHWLRARIDSDMTRQPAGADLPAEELPAAREELVKNPPEPNANEPAGGYEFARERAAREPPREYKIVICDDVAEAVKVGAAHAGILVDGPLPTFDSEGSCKVVVVYDQTEFRSYRYAQPGLIGVLSRLQSALVDVRLRQHGLNPETLEPMVLASVSVATPERVGGSILGQIVPFILIVMTISGAIYPAIDLTAGERERGTLETLMVAPVPTVDLITGKFIVVTLIGMLSATLNLLSVAGTVFFGGLGDILAAGGNVVFPLYAMPWVLLVLIPLAVMFSALLLAVCSFARSFKEAQNYVMPVMVAAMIPAVIGTLPGSRLEGPLLVMPVANIVLLTRDLFLGKIDALNLIWVLVSSTIYAGAAVAAAAKLFGQEAVLFADSGSIRALFVRRFFKPRAWPSASLAFLLLATIYLLHFFISQSFLGVALMAQPVRYLSSLILLLALLLGLAPWLTCVYARVRPQTTFLLNGPSPLALGAGLCLGLSTWVLVGAWLQFQQGWLPIPKEAEVGYAPLQALIIAAPAWLVIAALALTPAFVEELFFRGFVLNGLRGSLGVVAAVILSAVAFAMFHHSVHRLVVTGTLGLLYGLLAVRSGSIWPSIIAHAGNNGIRLAQLKLPDFAAWLDTLGFPADPDTPPPASWLLATGVLALIGLGLCLACKPRRPEIVGTPGAEPAPTD